ncbi:MAG: hypothetical protein L6R00_06475 [Phycisphaerae bacterium]|nr:hypothetical protein [Phycisphaerae bacterium]
MKPVIIDLIDQSARDVPALRTANWLSVLRLADRAVADIHAHMRGAIPLRPGQTRRAALMRAAAHLAAVVVRAIDELCLIADEPAPRTPRERRPRQRRKSV